MSSIDDWQQYRIAVTENIARLDRDVRDLERQLRALELSDTQLVGSLDQLKQDIVLMKQGLADYKQRVVDQQLVNNNQKWINALLILGGSVGGGALSQVLLKFLGV